MDTTSFADLSCEMQTMVMSHLSQHDLASCTLVSKTWKKIFTPVLWRHFEDRPEPEKKIKKKDLDFWYSKSSKVEGSVIGGALKRNGAFVQSIRLVTDMLYMDCFLKQCPPTFPLLTSIWIDGVSNGDEDDLAALINRCPAGLKEVVYCLRDDSWGCFEFGDAAVRALVEHADTLEVFRLEGDYVCSEKHIDRLLCSLPNLKDFRFVCNRFDGRGGGLDARAIVNSEWVCSNLEVFGCEIGNIPRPDITRNICGRPARERVKYGSQETSIELQRKVYAKLAKLTKLQELRLGFPVDERLDKYKKFNRDRILQFDCLAMTLESGLDLLKDLKELRLVDLQYLEMGIENIEEQEWVAEHWPKVTIGLEGIHNRRKRR